MASRFWVGGTGNWDASTTTNWAATSGGAGGASVPTSSDDVTFDSLSNATAYTVTITATAICANFTLGAPLVGKVTIAGAQPFNFFGNVNLSGGTAGITWTHNGSTLMSATSGTKTLTTNGVPIAGGVNFNGAGGTFQLSDNLEVTSQNGVGRGATATFDANGKTVTLSSSGIVQIAVNSFTGSNAFFNLTIAPAAPAKTNGFNLGADIEVTGTFTVNDGATVTNRVLIKSTVNGTQRTITSANNSIANADFQDIIGAGAASWNLSAITGLSGDCGGNSGITFTSPSTQHWVNVNGGSWSTAANWTSRVPLPQDTVILDCAFGTSKTVTVDMPRSGVSIDWTGATWTTSITWSMSVVSVVYGSMTLISGLTMSGSSTLTFSGRGSSTLDTKSVAFTISVTMDLVVGTMTLASDFATAAARTFTVTSGTLTCINGGSNYAITTGFLAASSGATLTLGSATHIITGISTTVVSINAAATLNAGTSTLKMTDTANGNIIFAGNGKTFYNVWFSRGASTGSITISGSNIFNNFKDDGSAAHSILFTAGTTQTITSWTVSGSFGSAITLDSTTTAIYTLQKVTGGINFAPVSSDWLNIQHCVAKPPGATWYAGVNSVNNQATATAGSGWIFTAPSSNAYSNFFPFFMEMNVG